MVPTDRPLAWLRGGAPDDRPGGEFAAKLLVDGVRKDGEPPLTELHGRFLVARGLIATAVRMT